MCDCRLTPLKWSIQKVPMQKTSKSQVEKRCASLIDRAKHCGRREPHVSACKTARKLLALRGARCWYLQDCTDTLRIARSPMCAPQLQSSRFLVLHSATDEPALSIQLCTFRIRRFSAKIWRLRMRCVSRCEIQERRDAGDAAMAQ